MSLFEAAALTQSLLVTKGMAAPIGTSGARASGSIAQRRSKPTDPRPRLTMRLEEECHRRIRLAAVHLRQSTQRVMLAALDHYLDHVLPTLLANSCRCLERGGYPRQTCAEACSALQPAVVP